MNAPALSFDMPGLGPQLASLSEAELDMLDFGVIGFDGATVVCRYNQLESAEAGLSPQRVLGQPLFTNVAPCMNNFMVAQRLQDALETGVPLDETLDYVFTLRMRPVKVKLRLLAAPSLTYRYVVVQRAA